MANLHRSEKKVIETVKFRFIPSIDDLDDSQLDSAGYYRGFVCPHGHTVRDRKENWCYHCVHKIQSNLCGFDINYLHVEYKAKYEKLWKKIAIGSMGECWAIDTPGPYAPKRVCMPSYRSAYSHQKAENLSFHKAIYNCAWGDVGGMVVTRLCGNPRCGNPLHMVSSWNKLFPPESIHPFVLEFQAEKLMVYGKNKNNPLLFNQSFRNAITFPENGQAPLE
ncbi:MAG: hypothetical protein RIQ82_1258 [Bacteroidota bacterium]